MPASATPLFFLYKGCGAAAGPVWFLWLWSLNGVFMVASFTLLTFLQPWFNDGNADDIAQPGLYCVFADDKDD